MSRSSEELIRNLSRDLPAVVPMGRLRDTVLVGLGFALPFFAFWIFGSGVREQFLRGETPDGVYLTVACVALLLAVGGLVAGLASAIPGREDAYRLGRNLGLAGLALGIAVLGYQISLGSTSGVEVWSGVWRSSGACATGATVLGLPIALFAARYIVRGFAPRQGLALSLACGGAVGFAAAVVHLTCSYADPLHQIIGHGLAPITGGLVILIGMMTASALTSGFLQSGER